MAGLTLSGIIFVLLTQAVLYYRLLPPPEEIDKITGTNKNVGKIIFLPGLLTLANIFLLNLNSITEHVTVGLLLWLSAIYFFLLLVKKFAPQISLPLAATLSQILILITYAAGQEYLNNLLVILAYTAAISLVFKRFAIPNSAIIAAFILMAIFDAIFVWLIPAIPTLEAAVGPLLFSPLLKVGDLTLGSGDIIFLLLAVLSLTNQSSYRAIFLTSLVLSLSVMVAVAIAQSPFMSGNSFPFLSVLTPIFLALFWLKSKEMRTVQNG